MRLAAFLSLLLLAHAAPASAAEPPETKIYELRTYRTRPGKLEALLARFRDHTCRLFEKHGMENVGYWTPVRDDQGAADTLTYLLAHDSLEAAKKSWSAFAEDPDWRAAKSASEPDGPLLASPPESIFLALADFSPLPPFKSDAANPLYELRDYTTPEGKVAAIDARFRDHTVALFEKHGIRNVAYFHPLDTEDGAGSRLIYLVRHPGEKEARTRFQAFGADPAWKAAKQASEERAGGSLTLPGGVRSTFLQAVDFSPLR